MSALNLDSFALEMREHYIATTLESLERFKSYEGFFVEVRLALADWMAEAKSNDMNHFVHLLESLQQVIDAGGLKSPEHPAKVSEVLGGYLQILKAENDSEALFHNFNELFQKSLGGGPQVYLQCTSQGHHFIIPVKNVIEIVGHRKIFPLPLAQTGVCGLMSFRGQGIPVINLSDFGFTSNSELINQRSFFVVCEHENAFFSLEVNSTDDVLELQSSQFQSCVSKNSEANLLSPIVSQFAIKENTSLMLLDIKKLVEHE